jgi:IPT/TIG domain-containing protein
MLLLPRTIVSGDRATLAVLDVNGRLTPGAAVSFSNGDRLTTDATGRALFVAPLTPGVIFASLAGHEGRVPVTVLPPGETAASAIQVESIPKIASITDRFEITGRGFCGDADVNQITISGDPALVLASSPTSLVVLPPADLQPGRASVDISCAKRDGPPLEVVFVVLTLEADSSPLAPGVLRRLTVHVRGTTSKVTLEAKNLAPDVAELLGGNPLKASSSGGAENLARFEVVGRKRGSFLVSIRLLSSTPRAR